MLSIFGCDSAPKPFTPSDMMTGGATSAGGEAGAVSNDDMGSHDMGPGAGEDTDAGGGATSGLDMGEAPDTEVDAGLSPPEPALGERIGVMIGGTVWAVWRRDDELWRAQFSASLLSAEPSAERAELLARRGAPWVSLPQGLTDVEIKLQVTHVRPYVIVSAPDREAFAFALTASTPTPIALGLTSPLALAEGEGALLVAGTRWVDSVSVEEDGADEADEADGADGADEDDDADGADEADETHETGASVTSAGIAWRFERSGLWSRVSVDPIEITSLIDASHALGGWVISALDEQCYLISERGGVSGSWRCDARLESVSVGDEQSLVHWGMLNREFTEVDPDTPRVSGLWTWASTPGQSINPSGAVRIVEPTALESSNPVETRRELARGELALHARGRLNRWVNRGDRPTLILNQSADDSADQVARALIANLNGSAPLPDQLEPDTIWELIERPEASPLLLTWDASAGALSWVNLADTWSATAPLSAPPTSAQCLAAPERCDEIDHDCDGAFYNQLCCSQGSVDPIPLTDVVFPELSWFIVDSEIGLLAAIASQGQARLFSVSSNGGDASLRSIWGNITRLETIGQYLSLIALIARDDADTPLLLINRRADLADPASPFIKRELSCEPRAVTVLDESHATRVYCAEHALLIEADGTETIEPYPEDGELMWMTPWMPEGIAGGEVRWLVALGDTHQLSVWRDEGRGGVYYLESDTLTLPSALGDLTPPDRLSPIQLPPNASGLLARTLDKRVIEVWIKGSGWTQLSGHKWPFSATLSPRYPAAITTGYDEDPQAVSDSFLQYLNIRIHPLTERGALLGELVNSRVSKGSFGGAHFGRYSDLEGAQPNFVTLIGGSLVFSAVSCR